jgi:fructose-1,6-bisphosphatase/inositol monophosphatase family enzyme
MTNASLQKARRLLCALQDHIRDEVIRARRGAAAKRFSQVAEVTEADTIYHIDKISEDAIFHWFERHWPKSWPVELVMEGVEGEATTFPRGTPVSSTVWKCIIDPIDGTRGIMYDKRPAWSLAGLAPQRGSRTVLADILVAAMTELPTSKQWRSDQLSAVRGGGVKAESMNVLDGTRQKLTARPSAATDFKHGFSSLARFFPDGKTLISSIEESIWSRVHRSGASGSPLVFDDQYISTGGQLYEVAVGHDRFVGDIRPIAFAKLGLASSLVCHPYDICTALVAKELGVVVEDPFGGEVRCPLDTTSPVSWVAFANPTLARKLRPILRQVLREKLG